jgi:hypothetical protein
MAEELSQLLKNGASIEQIGAHLDALSEEERIRQIRAVPGGLIGKLYDQAGQRPCKLEEFVPEVEATVVYAGRNSAPAFSNFAKLFWRRPSGEVVGYNEQTWRAFSGPGYFVAYDRDDEVIFDYTRVPDTKPDDWPTIRANRGLIAGPAFGNMIDHNRWVSSNTVVGRAFKNGKLLAHYLVTRTQKPV